MNKAWENYTPSREEIASLAHRLWEKEGRPEGREQIHWNQAEDQWAFTALLMMNGFDRVPASENGGIGAGFI